MKQIVTSNMESLEALHEKDRIELRLALQNDSEFLNDPELQNDPMLLNDPEFLNDPNLQNDPELQEAAQKGGISNETQESRILLACRTIQRFLRNDVKLDPDTSAVNTNW